MTCKPLNIPLKSMIPKTIATIDKPIANIQSSQTKNNKNVNLVNCSRAFICPIILIPKGLFGSKRKKVKLDSTASIPKTSDSIEVLLYISFSTLLFIINIKNINDLNFSISLKYTLIF